MLRSVEEIEGVLDKEVIGYDKKRLSYVLGLLPIWDIIFMPACILYIPGSSGFLNSGLVKIKPF